MRYLYILIESIVVLAIIILFSAFCGIIGAAVSGSLTIFLATAWIVTALALSAVLYGEYRERK